MDSTVETQIEGRCKDPGSKGFYLSLCGSLLLHIAFLSFFLPTAMNSFGTQQVSQIIIVSLGSGTWETESDAVSPETERPAVAEPPETVVIQEPVEKSVNQIPEETHLESPPAPELIPEVIQITEETVVQIPDGSTIPAQPAGSPSGHPVQDRAPTGPPNETMLAYAGGDLAPGILSSGSPKGEGDRFIPAVTLSLPEPSYPRVCRRRGQEGTVVLSVDIGVDGRPGKISVTDTSGFSRLDRAAADALKRAVFKPARQNAVFIKSTKQLAFTFRLEDEDN
jgi:protein TonB